MPDDEKPNLGILKDLTLVGPLHLDDAQGRWQFDPQPDITALELSLIMVLFVHTLNLRKRLGWREYLTRDRDVGLIAKDGSAPPIKLVSCNLARHFKPVE
jgi:hypothetical protein